MTERHEGHQVDQETFTPGGAEAWVVTFTKENPAVVCAKRFVVEHHDIESEDALEQALSGYLRSELTEYAETWRQGSSNTLSTKYALPSPRDRFGRAVKRSIVQDVQQVGVLVFDGASMATLDAVEVQRVAPPDCAGAACDIFGDSAYAFGAYGDSRIVATNFTVRDLEVCGVHVAEQATALLMDGEVMRAAIGACIQSDAQAVEDLQNGVQYIDNESNLQATMLPVPAELPGSAP